MHVVFSADGSVEDGGFVAEYLVVSGAAGALDVAHLDQLTPSEEALLELGRTTRQPETEEQARARTHARSIATQRHPIVWQEPSQYPTYAPTPGPTRTPTSWGASLRELNLMTPTERAQSGLTNVPTLRTDMTPNERILSGLQVMAAAEALGALGPAMAACGDRCGASEIIAAHRSRRAQHRVGAHTLVRSGAG